ncbi:pyruvate kinase [Neorhodopirellula lusitana]|uniref:pyruvate kinase n=1 Tax=Neorhodopirellula lusitana TaxID=445327 RepID=UPI00384E510B
MWNSAIRVRKKQMLGDRVLSKLVCVASVLFSLTASCCVASSVAAQTNATVSQTSFARTPVSLIPPGTKFTDQAPENWSHLISFVRGKLTHGDVDAVTETVRYYGELFNLVMLANVEKNASHKYTLDQVAVGFSMNIDGKNVIVDSATEGELGGNLSMIGRGVLDRNVAALSQVEQVARTPNSLVLDAPATLLRDGEHREMVVRYYIWVFPENGNLGTLVWLLDPIQHGQVQTVADKTVQLLPPNMWEDRIMNVKKSEFNFVGLPTKKAFALVQIPQGTAFEMSQAMQAVAAEKNYTADTLAELTAAIAETLKAGAKH